MTGAATLHASAVALGQAGLLILGPSGSGKSSLALGLIARGARLIADDRVMLERTGDSLVADAPAALAGMIEARGIGLVRIDAGPGRVTHACRLGERSDRLPVRQTLELHGVALPLFCTSWRPELADALTVVLRGGRLADPDGGE